MNRGKIRSGKEENFIRKTATRQGILRGEKSSALSNAGKPLCDFMSAEWLEEDFSSRSA